MTRRPIAITIVCALGALAACITAVLFAVDSLWALPPTPGQRALAFTALAVMASALYGMWRMRRWGVLIIALMLGARLAYGVVGHVAWNLPALAGPTVFLLVGLVYLRKMS
jgi:hypothetical protein